MPPPTILTALRRFALFASLLLLWSLLSPSTFALLGQARGVSRTFTAQDATGTTATFDALGSGGSVPAKHTAQVTVTGSPTGCTYHLEGSLDNSTWFSLSGAQDCITAANRMFHVVNKPVRYVRGNLTVLSGGTTPTAQLLYFGVVE